MFQFDVLTGGVLTPKTPPDVPAGDAPLGVAVSPDGKSVYVANAFSTGVSQYDIGMGGALTPKTPAFVPTGSSPMMLAINPDGKSVYVPNFGGATVSQLDVDPLSGVLSPKAAATVASGLGPQGIAVTPLPRVPTSKDQCKNGGWRSFPGFENQGDCVSFVATGGKNPPTNQAG